MGGIDNEYEHLYTKLKKNLQSFSDVNQIKRYFDKIISNVTFDDDMRSVIIDFMKSTNNLDSLLVSALQTCIDIPHIKDEAIFDIFKICISKYKGKTQFELLSYLVRETDSNKEVNLDNILSPEKQKQAQAGQ